MEKSLWKVKYIEFNQIPLITILRNGHAKGILYKYYKKRIPKKTCEKIIEYLEEEVGTNNLGSCIVDGDMISGSKLVKEYEI